MSFCEKIGGCDPSKEALLVAVLRHLSVVAAIVNATGRVMLMNGAARSMFTSRTALFVNEHGVLVHLTPSITARLHAFLGQLARSTPPTPANATFEVPRGEEDWSMRLFAIALHDLEDIREGVPIALFARDRAADLDTARSISKLYGLSPREERLASMLLQGSSLATAAEGLNLTSNTARTYLKQIFRKADVHSQSAFLNRVRADMALILPDRSRKAE